MKYISQVLYQQIDQICAFIMGQIAQMIPEIIIFYDLVSKILILTMLPLNLQFFYNLTLIAKLSLNFSRKTLMRSTIQDLKELIRVNYEILHKMKRKNGQLVNFTAYSKLYLDFSHSF